MEVKRQSLNSTNQLLLMMLIILKITTHFHTQSFQNFYALDDGTAEASYGVNVAGGKVAMRFNLLNPTLLESSSNAL